MNLRIEIYALPYLNRCCSRNAGKEKRFFNLIFNDTAQYIQYLLQSTVEQSLYRTCDNKPDANRKSSSVLHLCSSTINPNYSLAGVY